MDVIVVDGVGVLVGLLLGVGVSVGTCVAVGVDEGRMIVVGVGVGPRNTLTESGIRATPPLDVISKLSMYVPGATPSLTRSTTSPSPVSLDAGLANSNHWGKPVTSHLSLIHI